MLGISCIEARCRIVKTNPNIRILVASLLRHNPLYCPRSSPNSPGANARSWT
jgi:hypothetical protein